MEKKIYVEAYTKPVLWNANYDRENCDRTNAFRPSRFKWCEFFYKFYDIVAYARHFLLVKFYVRSIGLINSASGYREM